ncbi:tyrosine-type recombinase/integrase [Tunturiibacter lichenicola]|uniref:tyrosine-type recombinase/integrase n=1 Tax=Tunturiibacter lichenicola TaxID=2051959 RepID=UPI003D9BF2F3
MLNEAKVKKYRWHDNRHTFCSSLVQAGKSLKVVQELAGHRDIKMTAPVRPSRSAIQTRAIRRCFQDELNRRSF